MQRVGKQAWVVLKFYAIILKIIFLLKLGSRGQCDRSEGMRRAWTEAGVTSQKLRGR